eukprot:GEMP01096564.1.p2 GENE.GEMP01096564.1~~GEMP01096564.1.p2  ORF type:complete len:168 (+),score=47.13 GEMP01096564.1:110-613(+)
MFTIAFLLSLALATATENPLDNPIKGRRLFHYGVLTLAAAAAPSQRAQPTQQMARPNKQTLPQTQPPPTAKEIRAASRKKSSEQRMKAQIAAGPAIRERRRKENPSESEKPVQAEYEKRIPENPIKGLKRVFENKAAVVQEALRRGAARVGLVGVHAKPRRNLRGSK